MVASVSAVSCSCLKNTVNATYFIEHELSEYRPVADRAGLTCPRIDLPVVRK